MKKLKELISPSSAEKEWGHSHGWSVHSLESKMSPEYILHSTDYDNYKGYRFYTENLSNNIKLISMVLSDRPFIIGNIKIVNTSNLIRVLELFNKNSSYMVLMSQLHDKFKGKGLGYLMYEYVIKKYGIVMSDDLLYSGSYKLWTKTLPKYLLGPVFVIYSEGGLPSIQLVSNIPDNPTVTRFIAFSNKNKIYDKIYKACDYIKRNTNNYYEVSWLNSIKGKTETLKQIRNKNYDGLFTYKLSKDMFEYNQRFIILGQNYCILVHKNNSKIKVIDF